jgi:hypothetical protein
MSTVTFLVLFGSVTNSINSCLNICFLDSVPFFLNVIMIFSVRKRSAGRDRRTFVDNLAHEAEQAASHGVMSTVYKITKQLCGKTTPQPDRRGLMPLGLFLFC